ncbi:MAG: LysR family transcriptional regulator [Lachnospiraceae bacterium]|nr:LysR family transcriptional regulator [Lachnospiraceae bacterium]
MTLQHIKYIICVAQCGSISKAAKKLYISQPSLSAAIKKVEEEYKIMIFARSGKGVILTHEGDEFISNIKHIAEYTEMLEMKYSKNSQFRMNFCVATMHYEFATTAFIQLLETIPDNYNFGILEGKIIEVMENVKSGVSDIGILCFSKINASIILKELSNRSLVYNPLIERTPHIIIRASHPLSKLPYVTWESLKGYPLVSYYQGIESSLNFSSEFIYPVDTDKIIYISDKGAMYNILLNTDAYIIDSGVLSNSSFVGKIITKSIASSEPLNIGWICQKRASIRELDAKYLNLLVDTIKKSVE